MKKTPKNLKLSHRLFFYVLLCSAIFTILATAIQLYVDFKKDVFGIHDNIAYIEQSYAPAIAGSVYDVDNEQLKMQLEGALQLQDIIYLEVVETAGSRTYKLSVGERDPDGSIIKEIPLVHKRINGENFKCGALIVMASMKTVYQRLWSRMLIILTTNAVKTFLAAFFILLIIKFVVSRHLETLSDYTRTLDIGSLDNPLTLKRKKQNLNSEDELDVVVAAINDMRRRIGGGIAKREQVEKLLTESEKKYRSLFSSLNEGICLHEIIYNQKGQAVDYRILEVNPSYEMLLGIKAEEAIGRIASQLYGTDEPPYMDIYFKVVETGESASFETFFPPMAAHFKISVFSPGKGQFATLFDDITEKKQAEELLREHSERLEEMVEERTKDLKDAREKLVRSEKLAALGKLAGLLGHEIKAPLGVIKHSLEFLKVRLDQDVDAKIGEHLNLVHAKLNTMDKTIDDVLDFARTKELKLIAIDPNNLVEHVLKEIPVPANIRIVPDLGRNLPCIAVDERQIQQAFRNIIANAIDAMDEGGTLTVSTNKQINDNAGHEFVTISFRDTGEGISPDHVEKIFEPLFSTKVKGTGLGLVACENVIHAHGGSIEVSSEVGKGSLFTVKLPAGEV